jgi:anti-sigma factor RsiW
MICFGDEDRIHAYLDGELSPTEEVRFKDHLDSCVACQEQLAQARSVFAMLEALQPEPVPQGFAREVVAGVPQRSSVALGNWILLAQVVASLGLLAAAYPTLSTWYRQTVVSFAPGWLSRQLAVLAAWGTEARGWIRSSVALNIEMARPRGLGLAWPQAALLAVALLALWALGNHLLLQAKPDQRGGTT